MNILKLFDQNFLVTILQDINPKDIRIFVKNKKVLSLFKDMFGNNISSCLKKKNEAFLQLIYGNLGKSLERLEDLAVLISQGLSDEDLYHLRDNMYTMDFWVTQRFYELFVGVSKSVQKYYSDMSML